MRGRVVGLIRVLTTDDAELLEMHGRIISRAFAGLKVWSKCIPDQPEGVYDERTERLAEPKVVALAKEMAAEGVAAIVISCAADPGLESARRAVDVPVIGAGRAAACAALACADRIGVLGIGEAVPAAMSRVLGGALVGWDKPTGVRTTLDLLRGEARPAALEAAVRLQGRGAEAIVLACTGMSTAGLGEAIRSGTGLPVVDPVVSAGLFAWYMVRGS